MSSPSSQPASSSRMLSVLERIWLLLLAVFTATILWIQHTSTLELWDESRVANSALEMATRGHWLTPSYGWIVDHWYTKPPLLLWIVAALERLGVRPITALRLPSLLASLLTLAAIYLFCRNLLNRRFAALSAVILLASSTLFFGLHVALTGDYDALLCLFTTLYTLAFCVYIERLPGHRTSILLTGLFLALAILTKGIAGCLLLPGLFVYAILRRRLLSTLRDWRFWLSLALPIALAFLYYRGREAIDPGYLHAVWVNEIAGRYNAVNEGHRTHALTYVATLIRHFEPGALLLPLGLFTLRRRPHALAARPAPTSNLTPPAAFVTVPPSRPDASYGAALAAGITAALFLLVISASRTRISYYCAPAVPLLSLFAALGLSDALHWFATRRHATLPTLTLPRLQAAAFACLALFWVLSIHTDIRDGSDTSAGEQVLYGPALRAMRLQHIPGPVTVYDSGITDNPTFRFYNPVADYYARQSTFLGYPAILRYPFQGLPASPAWLVTCDPALIRQFTQAPSLSHATLLPGPCLYGQLAH